MADRRPFNADALEGLSKEAIRAEITGAVRVWKYTIFVPVEQIHLDDGRREVIATNEDLYELEKMFIRDFLGVTTGYEDICGIGSARRQQS